MLSFFQLLTILYFHWIDIWYQKDYLVYFRFLGRVLGRALFDRRLVKGRMIQHLYKHLLGWPITFQDLQYEDNEHYRELEKLSKMEDVSTKSLDFTFTEKAMDIHTKVEIVHGGSLQEVNNENLPAYLEAMLKYRMLERVKPQLTELLIGFFDVIPEPTLTIFDHRELESLLCGAPEPSVADWEPEKAQKEINGIVAEVAEDVWAIHEEQGRPETGNGKHPINVEADGMPTSRDEVTRHLHVHKRPKQDRS